MYSASTVLIASIAYSVASGSEYPQVIGFGDIGYRNVDGVAFGLE
jgi:hypothetical protein